MIILGIVARWVFVLSLPALFISASIAWGFNSLWLYKYGFEKYVVSAATGLPASELDKAARGLISYFNSNHEYIHVDVTVNGQSFELFNEEEQQHFKDVKQLIWLDYEILVVSLVVMLGYALTSIFWGKGKYRRDLARSVVWGSGISLALLTVLGIASLVDFQQLFLKFHMLAFSNQFWSAQGYMLLLFPEGFWSDAVLICIAATVFLAIIFGTGAFTYLRLSHRKDRLELKAKSL